MRALPAPDLLSDDYTGPSQWRGAVVRQTRADRISARAACAAYSKAAGLVVLREEGPPVRTVELARRVPFYLANLGITMGGTFVFVVAVALILGFRP